MAGFEEHFFEDEAAEQEDLLLELFEPGRAADEGSAADDEHDSADPSEAESEESFPEEAA